MENTTDNKKENQKDDETDEVYKLLTEWKLQHLYQTFKDQNITFSVLKILTPRLISKLFNNLSIGDQAIFQHNFDKWIKKDNIENKPEIANFQTGSIKPPMISVMDILNQTKNGKEILSYYAKHQILYEEQRSILLNTITKFIDCNGISCSLSDCAEMEKQICTIFPSEKLDFYNNGKRGKLYNKLANLKRHTKDAFKTDDAVVNVSVDPKEEDYTFAVQCIQSKSTNEEDFDLYWRKCAPYRFKQISDTKNTSEIFKIWPQYGVKCGSKLINIDFAIKFPMAKSLNERWSQFGQDIFLAIKTKVTIASVLKELKKVEGYNSECKIINTFWYMHYLFPPQVRSYNDASGAKIKKRFSIADSQTTFAIFCKSSEELEIKLKLLKLQGCCIQPKLLIIGTFEEITSIYVYFDELKYPFLTVIEAIDSLFKIFFVFNLEYPEECEVFYNFLQTFLYDMPSAKKYGKVHTLAHELKQKYK